MQQRRRFSMAETSKIIRKSIYTFQQNYNYFTATIALLAFPFSTAILLSQSYCGPLLPTIYVRLNSLFQASGLFSPSSHFSKFLNLKISKTISSSILTFPFALTFLLFAKSCIIQSLKNPKHSFSLSIFSIFCPLFSTYLTNSVVILFVNATSFSILFLALSFLEALGFSSPNFFLFSAAAIIYSIILANDLIVCNLALVLSGMENSGGFLSILKAFFLIRGRTSTVLALAVPVNLSLAAIEALFQFRVIKAYYVVGKINYSMALEGMFIAYLYSIFLVLDTVVSCIFFRKLLQEKFLSGSRTSVFVQDRSCRGRFRTDHNEAKFVES